MADEAPLNWSELANTNLADVEAPKSIPAGHYAAVITGAGKAENKGQKKTLCLTFPMRLTEPMADVDAEAFAASDGFNSKGYELQFWLTPNSLFRFTDFVKGLGGSDEMSVPEAAEWLANCGEPFVVEATSNESTKNPGRFYLNIDNPIPLSMFNEQAAA